MFVATEFSKSPFMKNKLCITEISHSTVLQSYLYSCEFWYGYLDLSTLIPSIFVGCGTPKCQQDVCYKPLHCAWTQLAVVTE